MPKRSLGMTAMCLAAMLAWVAVPSSALAQSAANKETARRLMDEGRTKEAARDYSGALKAYRAAHEIMKVTTTGVSVIKTLIALGQLVEARDVALSVARIPPQPGEHEILAKARAEAEHIATDLASRIPTIRIEIEGAAPTEAVTVELDGEKVSKAVLQVPISVNPGEHSVRVTAPGGKTGLETIEVEERQRRRLSIKLSGGTPAPVPVDQGPAKPTPWLTYVGFGIGGAGLLAGSITGAMSMSKTSAAKGQCIGNQCPPSARDEIDSANTMATISNVSFGLALAGAGIGVYGLMTSGRGQEAQPAPSSAIRVAPTVGVGHVGVVGEF